MLFSSIVFIWIFLPFVLVINWLIGLIPFKNTNNKYFAKNIFLLFSSFIFYAWGGIYYLALMLSVIVINYIAGLLIGKYRQKSRLIVVISVVLNLGILFYFKYFNLFISVAEKIVKGQAGSFGLKEVVLPIGISFYIFQALSYVVDVYRQKANPQSSFFTFALYVSLFPQLIAGPIVQYSDVEIQLLNREENTCKFAEGIKHFCFGLAKKVIIANTLAAAVDEIFTLETDSFAAGIAWFGMISYSLQIYYDFSGYSDMAIGIGKMLGFDFKANFNYPYISLSVTEFWRRWHISLSSWFKEYVYIPLGGNRKGLFRTCINLFLVFLLTGIWHGANFTFFIWGLYYALIIVVEKLFLLKLLNKNPIKILNWLYMIFAVMLGWVMFNASDINYGLSYISRLFVFGRAEISVLNYLSTKYLIVLFLAILLAGPVQRAFGKVYEKVKEKIWILIPEYIIEFLLLAYSIILIINNTYNPFIYFQF